VLIGGLNAELESKDKLVNKDDDNDTFILVGLPLLGSGAVTVIVRPSYGKGALIELLLESLISLCGDYRSDYCGDYYSDCRSNYRGDYRGNYRGDYRGDCRSNYYSDYYRDYRSNYRSDYYSDYRSDYRSSLFIIRGGGDCLRASLSLLLAIPNRKLIKSDLLIVYLALSLRSEASIVVSYNTLRKRGRRVESSKSPTTSLSSSGRSRALKANLLSSSSLTTSSIFVLISARACYLREASSSAILLLRLITIVIRTRYNV
jgi:hypothetical protein